MFRAVYRSSSGALTVLAACGLHMHVVTGSRQVWVGTGSQFPLRLDYGRSPHAYVNQRLQVQLELLMMSGVPLETCWAFNERWNDKFCCKVASCWLFLLNICLITAAWGYWLRCLGKMTAGWAAGVCYLAETSWILFSSISSNRGW